MGKTTWCNECEQYFAGVTHLCWRSSSAPEDVPAYLLANPIPRAKAPDPRDARIAELESALAELRADYESLEWYAAKVVREHEDDVRWVETTHEMKDAIRELVGSGRDGWVERALGRRR